MPFGHSVSTSLLSMGFVCSDIPVNESKGDPVNRIAVWMAVGLLGAGCASSDEHRVDMSHVSGGVTVNDKTANGAPLPGGGQLKLLKMVPPDYPSALRRDKVTGVVTV
jgi:hypothetical protein